MGLATPSGGKNIRTGSAGAVSQNIHGGLRFDESFGEIGGDHCMDRVLKSVVAHFGEMSRLCRGHAKSVSYQTHESAPELISTFRPIADMSALRRPRRLSAIKGHVCCCATCVHSLNLNGITLVGQHSRCRGQNASHQCLPKMQLPHTSGTAEKRNT